MRLWEGSEQTYMHCLVELNTRSDAVNLHDKLKGDKNLAFDNWTGNKCEGLVTEYFNPPKSERKPEKKGEEKTSRSSEKPSYGDLRDKLKSRKRAASPNRSKPSQNRRTDRKSSPPRNSRDSRDSRRKSPPRSSSSRNNIRDSRKVTERDEPLPKNRDQLHKIQRTIRQSPPPRDSVRRTINNNSRDAEQKARRAEEEKRRIQRDAERKLEDERRKRKALESQKESEVDKLKREMEEMKRQMLAMASQVH